MIEESFVRLYAHDFVQFAGRAEAGQEIEPSLTRRLSDARAHSALMDARKGSGHLAALVARLHEEGSRFTGRAMLKGADPVQAAKRHRAFLARIADLLSDAREEDGVDERTRLTRRNARPTLPSRRAGNEDGG